MPDVLVLCGGMGTRLRSIVADKPKALAEISGRPFLDFLSEELLSSGMRRQVLCVGYRGAQIAARYKDRLDVDFKISQEDSPLGTGGAVSHAIPHVTSDPFLVVNGDSYCRVQYAELLAAHEEKHALMSIVVTPVAGRSDVASVRVGRDGQVLNFRERSDQRTGDESFVNAGIYVMQREALTFAPSGPAYSLEHDLIPAIVRTGRCYAYPVSGPLIDIGTPERYLAAQGGLR